MTLPLPRYRFGTFELDVRSGELRRQGRLLRLSGQPFQILVALLERPNDIVTRDELRKRLWGEQVFVDFEHSLNTAMKRLRETLGDMATTPRFIETVPRRGYRFIAPVERIVPQPTPVLGISPTAPDPAPMPRPRWMLVTTAGLAVVIALVLAVSWIGPLRPRLGTMGTSAEALEGVPRLAVLSFQNLTGDPARGYIADGFTEELVSQLGRLAPGRLGVIAHSSSASFESATPETEMVRALGVDYVIAGSVRNEGDRYRVAVRLVRANDLSTKWSELYEGGLIDLMRMQRDVGQNVARQLALTLLPGDQAALARATTSDSQAYDAYLRGLAELARGPGEGFAQALELFTRAIAADPHYALAYAALAESYIMRIDYYVMSPQEAGPLAMEAARKALAIDDGLAEAHCALADVLSRRGERSAADEEFARALAINPSRAGTQLRYASHLIRTSRVPEARERLEQARVLAPRSADVLTELAYLEMDAGRLDYANRLASDALRYQPEYPFALYVLGHVALRRATPQSAIPEFERARVSSGHAPKYVFALATAYLAAARPDDAATALAELRTLSRSRYVPPGMIEEIATRLHQ